MNDISVQDKLKEAREKLKYSANTKIDPLNPKSSAMANFKESLQRCIDFTNERTTFFIEMTHGNNAYLDRKTEILDALLSDKSEVMEAAFKNYNDQFDQFKPHYFKDANSEYSHSSSRLVSNCLVDFTADVINGAMKDMLGETDDGHIHDYTEEDVKSELTRKLARPVPIFFWPRKPV